VALLRLLRTIDPGIVRQDAPPVFGNGKEYHFAVCLDARDPGNVKLKSLRQSREVGVKVFGCKIVSPGTAQLPIGMLCRLLKLMTETDVVLGVEKADVLTVIGSGSRFQFAMGGYRTHLALTELGPEVPEPAAVSTPTASGGVDWGQVAERYRRGEGFRALSRSIGVPETTIHGRLKRLGVQFNRRARSIA
jgi:hypothetical protein